MKVLVCGSRNLDRSWLKRIRDRFERLPADSIVIEGGAKGADSLARIAAQDTGLDVVEMPANWKRYGLPAGPIRNRRMLDLQPDIVIAFHPKIEESSGTKDCVAEAKRRGILIEVIA